MDRGKILVLVIWENPDKSGMEPDLTDTENLAGAQGLSLANVCG